MSQSLDFNRGLLETSLIEIKIYEVVLVGLHGQHPELLKKLVLYKQFDIHQPAELTKSVE